MTEADLTHQLLTERPGRLLSQVLRDLRAGNGSRVSVNDIVTALGGRSFAPLMVIFAAPNVFLYIPGSSVFTSLPLLFLAVQLILGRPDVWLPGVVANRSIAHASFARVVDVTVPYIMRVERLAKPRWWPTSALLAERIIGIATLVLAIFLFLPIPFANGVPALSIIMLALGLSEKDGYWLCAGLILTLVSFALVGAMVAVSGYAMLVLLFR